MLHFQTKFCNASIPDILLFKSRKITRPERKTSSIPGDACVIIEKFIINQTGMFLQII